MQNKTFEMPYERSSYNKEEVLFFNLKEMRKECKKERKKGKKQKKEKKKFWRSVVDKIIDAAISLAKEAAMLFFKHKLALV